MRRWLIKHEQNVFPQIISGDRISSGEAPAEKFTVSEITAPPSGEIATGAAKIILGRDNLVAHYALSAAHIDLELGGFYYRMQRSTFKGKGAGSAELTGLKAEIPGRIIKVLTAAGEIVESGAPLIVQEAMKMEMTLKSPARVRVSEILVSAGAQVEADALLIRFESAGDK